MNKNLEIQKKIYEKFSSRKKNCIKEILKMIVKTKPIYLFLAGQYFHITFAIMPLNLSYCVIFDILMKNIFLSELTLSFIMLKNGQTYFKNLAVFTMQDF